VADIDRPLPGFGREDRHLSFFLAFLVLMTIVVPMVGESRAGRIAIDLTFAIMLFSGAMATVNKRLLMLLIIALTILEFATDLSVEFNPSFSFRGWDTALKVLCVTILVVMTLKQTFLLPGPVSVHRVMGGIAAYLLIGVTWAFGYKLLLEMIPDAIHFQTPVAAEVATGEPGRLIYFSFETLTTESYGDAYPVHRIARSLTTAEALIGQLYPAILIATLVGMALQARSSAALKETGAVTSRNFIKDSMLIDPSMQKEIIRRAVDGNFGDNPRQAVHSLGSVRAPDGREVAVHLRHAADAVLLDDFGDVVLVTRKHNPGAGLKALPGGFMDPVQGSGGAAVAENAITAALREATEETGIAKRLLEAAEIIPVGHRSYNRPFDIRVAWGDMPGTDIKKGDFFAVSTQAFRVKTTQDLSRVSLQAGDDAKEVLVAKISSLTPEEFGVSDHLAMLQAAQVATHV